MLEPSGALLALDAAGAGQITGRTAFVALGVALLRAGLHKRAAARPARPVTVPQQVAPVEDRWAWMETPAPAAAPAQGAAPAHAGAPAPAAAPGAAPSLDFFAPSASARPVGPPVPVAAPPAVGASPSGTAGLVQLVAGAVLLAVGIVGLLLRLTPLGDTDRTIALPPTVLGLPLDGQVSAPERLSALRGLGDGVDDMQFALYGTQTDGLVVIAVTGQVSDVGEHLDAIPAVVGTGGDTSVSGGREVDAGRLGGEGRCWDVTAAGLPARSGLCAYADAGSVVLVLEAGAVTGPDAERRSRQVREAVLR